MGYRLGIICKEILGDRWIEHPKFYGYIGDEEIQKQSSYNYLKNIGIFSGDDLELFDLSYGFTTDDYKLTAEEFRIFITLYNQDLNNYEHDYGRYIWVNHPNGFYFCELYDNIFHDLFWSNYDKIIRFG